MTRRTAIRSYEGRPLWRRWFPLILGLLLLLLAPMVAFGQGASTDSVSLTWTAPGDDGAVGRAALYDMRIAKATITLGNWDALPSVAGMPAPLVSGQRQNVTVRGLSRDTVYWFAIRTRDDAGNWSALSNVVRWDWNVDQAPPAAPSGILASVESQNIRVRWSANGEPDLQGYSVYRATNSGGPFARQTGTLVTATQWVDTAVPAGAASLWYRVTATDFSGNESAQSANVRVDVSAGAGVGADWTMATGYPNPSRAGQSVCLPLVVPIDGPGNSAIEIDDGGGRRVRRFLVASASTCPEGVIWDGRNDAGLEVAPGVYRAWLVVGDRRAHVNLVRQP